MKVQRLIVVSVLVQFIFLTSASGSDTNPSRAGEDIPVTSSNEESAKERGMKDKDRGGGQIPSECCKKDNRSGPFRERRAGKRGF